MCLQTPEAMTRAVHFCHNSLSFLFLYDTIYIAVYCRLAIIVDGKDFVQRREWCRLLLDLGLVKGLSCLSCCIIGLDGPRLQASPHGGAFKLVSIFRHLLSRYRQNWERCLFGTSFSISINQKNCFRNAFKNAICPQQT